MLCHAQPNLQILFAKLTAQIRDYITKKPSTHNASEFGELMTIK